MVATLENGAMRVMKAMPMPESANDMGSSAGSAPGASLRTAKWATTKAAKMPMGTDRESKPTVCPSRMAMVTNRSATIGAASRSRMSSMLRRVMGRYPCEV